MKKSDLCIGMNVSFPARHGEVLGIVTEINNDSVIVTSDLDQSHRYRVPITFILNSNVFKERKVKK